MKGLVQPKSISRLSVDDTTATQITAGADAIKLTLCNNTGATLYLGMTDAVDDSNGFPLLNNAYYEFCTPGTVELWVYQNSGGTVSLPILWEKEF